MPMPPLGEDPEADLDRSGGRGRPGSFRQKPKVIGKQAPPTKMSEDGTSDWGERCIDLYDIVDKVSFSSCASISVGQGSIFKA
jgi:hypothetical protein